MVKWILFQLTKLLIHNQITNFDRPLLTQDIRKQQKLLQVKTSGLSATMIESPIMSRIETPHLQTSEY